MDLRQQFVGENGVDPALAFDAAEAGEFRGYNFHDKMCLAAVVVTQMAFVACAVVDHFKLIRRESGGQFRPNCVSHTHCGMKPGGKPSVKRFVFLFFHERTP